MKIEALQVDKKVLLTYRYFDLICTFVDSIQ